MSKTHFTTFAYGSNMLASRIRARCPSARPIGISELPGYRVAWHKRSADGSGKCDLIRTEPIQSSVWGVLYEILRSEKRDLDRAEGLGYGYDQAEIEIALQSDPIRAVTYIATDIDESLRPYSWYKALVVAGAREHGLPREYVDCLERIETIEDLDRARHRRNMQIISQ